MTHHSRVDLYVHSHHSRTAGNWILDQIQINECYTDPLDVYKIAKSRGMDFVTITDHDVIPGALEVAHMTDFFISEEISAFFPNDKAKVHILALNINESQHQDIQRLRRNIYELVPYLNEQKIVHVLAHPFFKMGPSLTLLHIEQMLLLFNIFDEPIHHGMFSLALAYAQDQSKNIFSRRNKKTRRDPVLKSLMRTRKQDEEIQQFLLGNRPFNYENNLRFFKIADRIVNEQIAAMLQDDEKSSLNKI